MHHKAVALLYSPIDARHTPTGRTNHRVNGELLGPASHLIIYRCGTETEAAYYLLGYNLLGYNLQRSNGKTSLTRHADLEAARGQAELEYSGVDSTWEPVQSQRADFERAMAKVSNAAPDAQDRL